MSEQAELAAIILKASGESAVYPGESAFIAKAIIDAGFRKPRVVDREQIRELAYEFDFDPPVFGLTRDQAGQFADAILALISPPEVETKPWTQLKKYTYEEMMELNRERGIDIIDD